MDRMLTPGFVYVAFITTSGREKAVIDHIYTTKIARGRSWNYSMPRTETNQGDELLIYLGR
jgi:hypothetical protein